MLPPRPPLLQLLPLLLLLLLAACIPLARATQSLFKTLVVSADAGRHGPSRARFRQLAVNLPAVSFKTMVGLFMRFPDIIRLLDKGTNVTAFVPTDDAFAALNATHPDYLARVLSSDAELLRFVKYHIVPYRFDARWQTTLRSFQTTLGGEPVRVDLKGSLALVGSGTGMAARVLETAFVVNGAFTLLDNVLVPPVTFDVAAAWAGAHAYVDLVAAVPGLTAAMRALDKVTFFVPSNEALQRTLGDVGSSLAPGLASALVDGGIVSRVELMSHMDALKVDEQEEMPSCLPGQSVTARRVSPYSAGVRVSGAGNVVGANIVVSDIILVGGSVMHIVNEVVLPAADTLAAASALDDPLMPAA
ncbi:fatty acid synthase beta subunit fas1 [Polyrhizophydium stewartii]|uniref:Fatty acid synthase beta subunit fas1 n=1 Tax=Polyrhizophydium stewartii TaxID=2732419 RepID=A0ABR4NKR2_9FUNG|nr:hypothetical protein HK105_008117 [Polyrhizophydium stewartii]